VAKCFSFFLKKKREEGFSNFLFFLFLFTGIFFRRNNLFFSSPCRKLLRGQKQQNTRLIQQNSTETAKNTNITAKYQQNSKVSGNFHSGQKTTNKTTDYFFPFRKHLRGR
jgi:hypothetical protein